MRQQVLRFRAVLAAAPVLLAMVAGLLPSTAAAQSNGLASWIPNELQAGALVVAAPNYEGAKGYRFIGVPIIAPAGGTGDGVVQFKGVDDVRFRLVKLQGLEAGALAGYRFGREEDDGRLLRGLGDVDGGLVVGGYMGYRMGGVFPFVSFHHQVTGSDTGSIARFGLEATTKFGSTVDVTTTAGATWGSGSYQQSFFGVSALQSARSGLLRYDAEAGIKDVFIGAVADVRLNDRWTLKLSGRYSHLVGSAADSPIVESEHQLFGGVGLTYRFSIK